MILLRFFIVFILLNVTQSDTLLKPGEELIFGFKTESGKQLLLARKNDAYIVYRFGKGSAEFEFPKDQKGSWEKMTYSYYLRGGGSDNAGMDLNYVNFINGKFQYIIYEEYHSEGEKNDIGIKVKNLGTGAVTVIKGIVSTQQGSLIKLRDNDLIQRGEELFGD